MSILIVGSEGSMGKRYQAILKYLNKPFFCRDLQWSQIKDQDIYNGIEGIIIATPTDTHAEMIRKYIPYRKSILCEKPVTKNMAELKSLLAEVQLAQVPFQMMLQYKNLIPKIAQGESHYDYFRHGNDGLVWDCLQIIGLAQREIRLAEKSPIWDCVINGHRLHSEFMDQAYVTFVASWLRGHPQDLNEVLAIHQKVSEFENAN